MESVTIQLGSNNSDSLVIYPGSGGVESLIEVPESEADEWGEATIQLKEGCTYEYRFSEPDLEFVEAQGIVIPLKSDERLGVISPNTYVGSLELNVRRKSTDLLIHTVRLEIRSVKSSYREDYRFMVEAITEKCTDLLMQVSSPVTQSFAPDFERDSETAYQRFSFVNSIVGSESFASAMNRILTSPATRWSSESEEKDIRHVRRLDRSAIRQFASSAVRLEVPINHPIRNIGLKSVPAKIISTKKTDTVDTPENRFIKHALETFLTFCLGFEASIEKHKSKKYATLAGSDRQATRAQKEAKATIKILERFLNHSMFAEVSRPETLPLNSPTLQRKAGYREILRVWLMFDLAARLVWKGGEDVYSAGKRDVATLYEYWLFFVLLDAVEDVFTVSPKSLSSLWRKTGDKLALQLKQGVRTVVKGVFDSGTRKLNVRFNYNRTFSGGKTYPERGSWTNTMRPDYTLSFWPVGVSLSTAEKEELVTHVHFDAKYKVDGFMKLVNLSDETDHSAIKSEVSYKNIDLLKMHAYRDAIRRTGGAYVLYPGSGETGETMNGFREIIPGLGAFPISPSKSSTGVNELKSFLRELVAHLLNRASQRERMAHRTWDIYRGQPNYIDELMPEPRDLQRDMIPDDTYVLVGLCKSDWHRNWIDSRKEYNIRTGDRSGAIPITKKEIGARFLLLYEKDKPTSGMMKSIFGHGPRFHSAKNMKLLGYDSEENYLLFPIKDEIPTEFEGVSWDLSKLPRWVENRPEGSPFVITLTELMRLKVNE